MHVDSATDNAACSEVTVGAGWKQLFTTRSPCSRVWLGAPLAIHPKGSINVNAVLVFISQGQPTSLAGGMPLTADNAIGLYRHVSDASRIWLYGFAATDVVEVQVE